MDWRLVRAGHGRTLAGGGAGRTRDLSRLSLRRGQLAAGRLVTASLVPTLRIRIPSI